MRHLQPLSSTAAPAPGSSLAHMKAQQLAREEEEKLRARRVKGVIVLVEQFLLEQGYQQTLQALQQESRISLTQFSAADNIDLLSVVQDYEEYYAFKCQRAPKLYRVRGGSSDDADGVGGVGSESGERMLSRTRKGAPAPRAATSSSSPASLSSVGKPPPHLRPTNLARALSHVQANGDSGSANGDKLAAAPNGGTSALGLSLQGESAAAHNSGREGEKGRRGIGRDGEGSDDAAEDPLGPLMSRRILKPLPPFPTNELNELAATILREILDVNPSVRWRDIADLESAKHLLQEAVVMPVKYPELFQGILRPWKGILLFGPPGTGKTLLAKAVATECRTTFFNIAASSVVSKWRGDSEKLVRMLFDLAVHYAPSTIFIDEIDSLMSARSSDGEHEGSRRMKTELLTQMDGLSKRRGGEVVFVLAASNVPWDLDTAMLRRLEKRILVSLPTRDARVLMFRRLLPNSFASDADYEACAALTEGMSGADIDVVCREAMMRPVRKLISQLEAAGNDRNAHVRLPSEPLKPPAATLEDVQASVACTRSSVRAADLDKYDVWTREHGSGLST
ncbi:katanin-like protein [Leishmania infantum JPCM5]|uniref:Katanin p60 ATPase-containing subunit A-like 2 n=2 Tax=Leishmania infantum TaxID=5671 RepID=A0A6L0WML8_LEIIN|nr:katanin-like protein [Leishmania infantum JPCM5]CAC9466024.1 katanin-like_protein [Leishmania infantum]CAM66491.2 katanin-like protein [Leishmania infantum JPCM5]SUZ40145.1 katanin-like_protein [Leishmania infantum]|eukprot:XP_001464115.2 katanin-like protein [Leishmania infantum JPCM5]